MIKIIRHATANFLIGLAWRLLKVDCSYDVKKSFDEFKFRIDEEWSRL